MTFALNYKHKPLEIQFLTLKEILYKNTYQTIYRKKLKKKEKQEKYDKLLDVDQKQNKFNQLKNMKRAVNRTQNSQPLNTMRNGNRTWIQSSIENVWAFAQHVY